MTAPLDFAMLPPEVNSARMYSGAGSGPMLAAASAWHGLAVELRLTATGYSSVLSDLTGQAWHGPSSATMTAAVAPYVAWLSTTATQAEADSRHRPRQPSAAYEAAFAAMVPPPVIAANRTQLMVLVATNFLGQNTAAIAATEAQYTEMWAQDAAAMYGYAGSSAAASQLTSFTQPEQVASATGPTAQAAAVTEAAAACKAAPGRARWRRWCRRFPGALQSLASPASSGSGLSGILDGFNIFAPGSGSSTTGLSGVLDVISGANGSAFGGLPEFPSLQQRLCLRVLHAGPVPGQHVRLHGPGGKRCGRCGPGTYRAWSPVRRPTRWKAPLGSSGGRLGDSVGLGRARALIGPLSVPPTWATPAPLHSPLSSTLGPAPLVAPPPGLAASTPPVPLANMAAQGEGRAVPQYGFRPSFVARPPAAG